MRNFLFLALTLSLGCFAQGRKLPSYVQIVPRLDAPTPKTSEVPKVAQNQTAQTRCAHIIVYKPDPNLDRKMVIGGGQDYKGRMPVITPPPVCPEDVRELPHQDAEK
jgi:hypothetical protein